MVSSEEDSDNPGSFINQETAANRRSLANPELKKAISTSSLTVFVGVSLLTKKYLTKNNIPTKNKPVHLALAVTLGKVAHFSYLQLIDQMNTHLAFSPKFS